MKKIGQCQCGCGELTRIAGWTDKRTGSVKGVPRKFINGHQRRQPRPSVRYGKLDGTRVAYIPLTQGKWAIVDRDRLYALWQYHWMYSNGYAVRHDGKRLIYMHRVLLGIEDETGEVEGDHMFGDGLDNRMCRLRRSSEQQNQCNKQKAKNNTSGFKGVSWIDGRRKWRAGLVVKGCFVLGGYFDSKVEAAKARDILAVEHHGEFARLNFPRCD